MHALLNAVISGNNEAFQKLLDAGEDIHEIDKAGRTVLFYAASFKRADMLKVLIEHGLDVNLQDNNGQIPLHMACQQYDLQTAILLINAGSKIDVQDKLGNTPLFYAVTKSGGKGDLIRYLLQKGADKDIKNNHGNSAYIVAEKTSNFNLVQFFQDEC